MGPVAPDLAGFTDAQQRLRERFGEPVVFLSDVQLQFAAGTQFDAETGMPYDPVLEPTASAQASATVRCDVAFRAIGNEVDFSALGAVEQTHVMLIADIADRAACEPCDEFVCRGERFQVTAQKPDGIGGLQRWLVFGRRR
jgi:hypothetical protein